MEVLQSKLTTKQVHAEAKDDPGLFIVTLAPILLHTVHDLFSLDMLDPILAPFVRLDENRFEHFIAAVHVAYCKAHTLDGKTKRVTVKAFYGGVLANSRTQALKLTIKPGMTLRSVAEPLSKYGVEAAHLIAEGVTDKCEVVDLTTSNFVVVNKLRDPAGDIYCPQVTYQAKSSQHVSFGRVPTETVKYSGKSHGRNDSVEDEVLKIKKTRKDGLIVVVTNKEFSEFQQFTANPELIPDGVIIVCRQNFRRFFKTFATMGVCL